MMFFALLMFPLIEISLVIAVVKDFGFSNAFFAWLVATILGVGLVRTAGLRLTVGVAQAMRQGKAPGQAALDGALVGLAGVLLVLPGYFSDAVALVLLVPPIRRLIAKRAVGAIAARTVGAFGGGGSRAAGANGRAGASYRPGHSSESNDASNEIIDVEAVVVEPTSFPKKN